MDPLAVRVKAVDTGAISTNIKLSIVNRSYYPVQVRKLAPVPALLELSGVADELCQQPSAWTIQGNLSVPFPSLCRKSAKAGETDAIPYYRVNRQTTLSTLRKDPQPPGKVVKQCRNRTRRRSRRK